MLLTVPLERRHTPRRAEGGVIGLGQEAELEGVECLATAFLGVSEGRARQDGVNSFGWLIWIIRRALTVGMVPRCLAPWSLDDEGR